MLISNQFLLSDFMLTLTDGHPALVAERWNETEDAID